MGRFILHSDLNNFYASVESLYNPEIRNKCVVVVGDEEKRHGIVLAKNYRAKAYGIKTGDTVYEARKKCEEELVCVPARLDLYLRVSKIVKDIYREYSDRVESFGIDEAWIDVSHMVKSFDEAKTLADNIRTRIVCEIGLTVSIGVSFNKVFAKLASDLKKPNATIVINEDGYKDIVWKLPVEDLLYVGRATRSKFYKANINTIGELATADRKFLKLLLGKMGETLHDFANGLDTSVVTSIHDAEVIKSIGNSTTCPVDLKTNAQVKSVIYMLAESVAQRLRAKKLYTKGVSVWIKDNELKSFERQCKLPITTCNADDIASACYKLFLDNYNWTLDVRSLGVRANHLGGEDTQCDIFSLKNQEKVHILECALENLKKRFGYNIIRRGNIMADKDLSSLNPETEIHIIHPMGFFKAK